MEAARPKDKRYTLADEIAPGLNLVVQPTGAKVYRLWTRIHGKQVPITIGDASLTTLPEARAKAKGVLAAIVNGEDPREAKRAAVWTASETVEAVARSFIERHAKVHNRLSSWQETERLIARNILPAWGQRPITSIARRNVIELLDVVVDRDAPVAANRVLTAGRKMFNWAIDRGLLETSPFERVKAPTPETSRDRTPTNSELALILSAANSLGFPFGPFVKLLVFLGQRRAEVAGIRWSELDEGLTLWTLPRERAKNNIQHEVPIAPEVREILVGLPRFEGSDFVLTVTGTVSITGYSQCKIAVDAAITELNGGEPIRPWRIHD